MAASISQVNYNINGGSNIELRGNKGGTCAIASIDTAAYDGSNTWIRPTNIVVADNDFDGQTSVAPIYLSSYPFATGIRVLGNTLKNSVGYAITLSPTIDTRTFAISTNSLSGNADGPNFEPTSQRWGANRIAGYQGSLTTSAPAAGSWDLFDLVMDSYWTAGHNGWYCTVAGTTGTLTGVTGSINSASKTLTLVGLTANEVIPGMYITIVGVTGVKKIVEITSGVATIDVAADATVTGAAVAYQAPTFVEWKGM